MSDVSARELVTVTGDRVRVPDPDHLVHLQFRRFAGCPICNLHLRSVVQRHDEIVAAGVREVVFFHSPAAQLREYDLPFAVVADPDRRYYREFGVESGRRALLHPRAARRFPDRPGRAGTRLQDRRARLRPVVGRRVAGARRCGGAPMTRHGLMLFTDTVGVRARPDSISPVPRAGRTHPGSRDATLRGSMS